MQFLHSIKKGTLQVGIALHKKSWATPRKKLSASILGYFIDRMSAARAHQTAHWNRLSKEASTKLRVGASEKMARRFSSPARSLRTVMTLEICSVSSIYSWTQPKNATRRGNCTKTTNTSRHAIKGSQTSNRQR